MKNSEYDQEIPQSQTVDNPMAPRGRAALMNTGMDSMKNDKTVRFLKKTCMDPLENPKAVHFPKVHWYGPPGKSHSYPCVESI